MGVKIGVALDWLVEGVSAMFALALLAAGVGGLGFAVWLAINAI